MGETATYSKPDKAGSGPSLPDAVLIAGPTASGKTAFAIERAIATGGVIIDADSMQVYDVLRIITARPSDEELSLAPHLLFGHVNPTEPYSVARWADEVAVELAKLRAEGRIPVFVGGTGLYFQALLEGLTPIPQIPDHVRGYWRDQTDRGGAYLHGELQKRDPEAARRLRPTDRQRILRALEIHDATGMPMHVWQEKQPKQPLLAGEKLEQHVLLPERALLYERINQRFDQMVECGALEEVERFNKLKLPHDASSAKAIGVRELSAFLAGEITLEEAKTLAKTASRQYAKRQMTWFRNQLDDRWKVRDPLVNIRESAKNSAS